MQPAIRQRLDPAVVLTPAGSSPPIRREIRRFAALICLPAATRGCLPELGDTGRAAIGLAGSFNFGKTVTIPFVVKARRARTGRIVVLPD